MSYIAILGATSQIASDLVLEWSARTDLQIDLFARRPQVITAWLAKHGLSDRFRALSFENFGQDGIRYGAIINFVGVGDPGRAACMGASILEITRHYDEMALAYQERFPETRYLFLSSGAVYGSRFPEPVRSDTPSCININDFPRQEFYAVAKLYTEITHRARPELPIIDIRVFNIFSRTQNLSARFLITDITRALIEGAELVVDPDPMTRDFLHPSDFTRLVDSLLSAPKTNTAVDCYSRGAVSKVDLLAALQQRFGLNWRAGPASVINATGAKPNYYSLNHKAAEFGYEPQYSSIEGLELEISAILGR